MMDGYMVDWRRVDVDVASLTRLIFDLRHVTSGLKRGGPDGYLIGETLWGTTSEQTIALCWDWDTDLHRNEIRPVDGSFYSNARLVDSFGTPLEERLVQQAWLSAIAGLEWIETALLSSKLSALPRQ